MTGTHALSAVEFGSLAAGDPDAAVIRKLLSGQLSKRIVMLRAILDLTADRCPTASPGLDEAYGVLAQAQEADPDAVRTLLTHPSVGAWAARCLHRLQSADDAPVPLEVEIGQFATYAAAAAIRADLAFTLTVPLRDGAVMLPTLGLATFPSLPAAALATISYDHDQIRIAANGRTVTVPADPTADGEGWLGLRTLRSNAANVTAVVEFDDIDPSRSGHANPLSARSDRAAVDFWQAKFSNAWELLATQYPRRADTIAAGFRVIVPLQEQARGNGASITARGEFGAIVMTPPGEAARLADTLIHEFHHSVLYAVMDMVTLHAAAPAEEHYSPWRDDPRPLPGLLHGAYAYLGVVDFWRGQRGVLAGPELLYADFEFARWRHQVAQAARVLLDSGLLTAPGVAFANGMATTAGQWLDLPVDKQAQELADRTTTDHYVRWRLRNRRPDPVAISALTNAWLAGRPCPVDPGSIPCTVAPAERRLALGDRVRLCGLRLRDPAALDTAGASAGDVAYVRDEFSAARSAYEAAITDDPDDIESWAGLTLTLIALNLAEGIADAPEVARAVYRNARGQIAVSDLVALGRWLAGDPVRSGRPAAAVGS
jgi:HEXXH motif-containing protein